MRLTMDTSQFGADCQALCGSATWTLGTCLRLMWQLKRRRFEFSAMITDMEILFSRLIIWILTVCWPSHDQFASLSWVTLDKMCQVLSCFLNRCAVSSRAKPPAALGELYGLCCFSRGTPLWLARWLKLFTSWSVFQNDPSVDHHCLS